MDPSTDWKERVENDETERFERLARELREIQRARARGGDARRALHAKGSVGAFAVLDVAKDLPPHARQGLFAEPRTYEGYVRFSNGSPARQADAKGDVRGMALKLVGVPGKKVIPGLEDAKTQDFLAIQTSSTPFRSPDEFIGLVKVATKPARLFGFVAKVGPKRFVGLASRLKQNFGRPQLPLAASQYFSALPIRFGDYAVRYTFAPRDGASDGPRDRKPRDYLGDELAARLRSAAVEYDLRVQFFVDEHRTPIEDPSVDWAVDVSPYLTVATLTMPKQDVSSETGKKLGALIETLSFDPWHALEAHRPLGAMMRARNVAYRLSTQERGAAGEPDTVQRP